MSIGSIWSHATAPLAIVLIGVSGCGKSTVGLQLAPALGATFLEGDAYHPTANIAKMRAGVPLDDRDRMPWLESLGHAIGTQAAEGHATVTACSALKYIYRHALADAAGCPLTFVHLTIDPARLAQRISARRRHFMPVSLLESQLATWEPLRADEDGTTLRETGTTQQTVAAIMGWMQGRATT